MTVIVIQFIQRQYSVQDRYRRRISGWLVHVLAEKVSFEALLAEPEVSEFLVSIGRLFPT